MTRAIRLYSPDGTEDATGLGAGTPADEQSVTDSHQDEWRGESANHLTDTKLDAKEDGGDQANARGGDSTIRGAGGLASGRRVMASAPMNMMLPLWGLMINFRNDPLPTTVGMLMR